LRTTVTGADSPSLASEFVLESLGFPSVFKAYHQIVGVLEGNDDPEVRISLSK
jgi:hypothetical protein